MRVTYPRTLSVPLIDHVHSEWMAIDTRTLVTRHQLCFGTPIELHLCLPHKGTM